MTVDIHTLRCAGCQEPIHLSGFTWYHGGLLGTRSCPPPGKGGHARPEVLDVFWFVFANGSESYHLVHEETEYVLWHHADLGHGERWSAWETSMVDRTTEGAPLSPSLTVHQVDMSVPGPARDPRPLLAAMPPLVGYWITDKVFPF